jgi:hypothetical protein
MGGGIEADTEKDEGSRFAVRLPAVEDREETEIGEAENRKKKGARPT